MRLGQSENSPRISAHRLSGGLSLGHDSELVLGMVNEATVGGR